MPQLLWGVFPVHLSPSRSCPKSHQGSIGKGLQSQGKNSTLEDIIQLLEFSLKNTYFSFQGLFYKQVEGAVMGSPVSQIVANLYMEYFEQKALSTAIHPPPSFWHRYADDTFVIQKEIHKQDFLQHINSVDPAILPQTWWCPQQWMKACLQSTTRVLLQGCHIWVGLKFPDISLTKWHFSLTIYFIFWSKKKLLIVIKGNPSTHPGFLKGNNSTTIISRP